MGNYQEYLKMMPSPLREIDPDQPKRLHTFGNPFKQDKKVIIYQHRKMIKYNKYECCVIFSPPCADVFCGYLRGWWSMKQMSLSLALKTKKEEIPVIPTRVLPWREGGACLHCCGGRRLHQETRTMWWLERVQQEFKGSRTSSNLSRSTKVGVKTEHDYLCCPVWYEMDVLNLFFFFFFTP